MRLWHEKLLPLLPRQQLLGQHRECCALRGLSWGRKHTVVDYVFSHPIEYLFAYHLRVMAELERRGYRPEPLWRDPGYRGRRCPPFQADIELVKRCINRCPVYTEHNSAYLRECLDNLERKGVIIQPDGKDM